jgi:hypothetical protein
MTTPKYYGLKEQYPEYISLDQLSVICKIAKRSAKYLVEQGIIPAEDTGKKTWRYKIALDDVITYLRSREQVGSMIPVGRLKSRTGIDNRKFSNRKCFAQLVKPGMESEVAAYFNYIFADYDELLTAADIIDMTGLDRSTVLKLLKKGEIKSIMARPKYLVPKPYLLEFVVTPRFIEYRTDSEHFKKIIGGFEIWTSVKSSQ